ncbi:hypothetical protein AXG93_4295s1350 [Marchantia polymorpha subsp. ruderalis]|uniref:Uncharacterized protein n=1 Tax=Marchantia polymorpha subsp. ruderalis TaxID=1480154 RepID=A0A176WAL2_MARPO|nr:hypothetical protein AXG93_4295s1350 [Marchantia polymorpha subsp. ruderalis]
MDDHATLEKLPALAPCDCLFLSGGLWRLQKTEIDNTSVGDKNTNKLSVELFLSNVRRLMRAKQKKRAGSSTVIIPRGMQVSLEENLKGHIALSLQFIMDLFSEAQTVGDIFGEVLYQLFEKIVADYLCEWANTGDLDIEVLTNTFERHFSTVRHLMKFPNWGSLIVQYNTKLTGEIVAQLSTAVCINHYAEESQQTALLNLLELAKHATTDVT